MFYDGHFLISVRLTISHLSWASLGGIHQAGICMLSLQSSISTFLWVLV